MSTKVLVPFTIGILTTGLLIYSSGVHLTFQGMLAFTLVLVCFGYLALRSDAHLRKLGSLRRLQGASEQLDQQAKLMIRTDMELRRTQEELDRRLTSLMSLHELGQRLEVNLRPEEVYGKFDARIVTNFGFSKGLLGTCPSPNSIEWGSLFGVNTADAKALRAHLTGTQLLRQILSESRPQTLNATSSLDPARRQLLELLRVPTLVVARVKPHSGPAGCLLLGRSGPSLSSAIADEEFGAILANQLATAVDNSKLFEETWTAQQELERKVQQRTHELAQANEKLVQLNNAKSDFVSAVSHELRTPLAAIKGYAALLSRGQFGSLSKPQSERTGKIEKHSDALTRLINNLLDIARIESGRVTMEHQMIQVEEFLGSVHDLVYPQMDAKHIRYDVDRDGITQIHGDVQQLQRVFLNLLSNAIKYTPEKGSIHVGFRHDGDAVVASVTDSGCGISQEDLPKLFQEFYRSDDPINQQIRGTGLGLALVKRIIDAHHGSISITSEKGKGSTFTVRLPTAS